MSKHMNILYITYTDLTDTRSGSGVRPARMYEAFLAEGHTVKLLSGECGRKDKVSRKKAVYEVIDWLKENRPDFCYIESSTYPIMFGCDYKLIRKLHHLKIPTGYFYRDFYRKFPKLFPRRKGIINSMKEFYLDYLQFKTDRILHLVDLIYFSSESDFQFFDYKNTKTLPPAGFNCLPEHKERNHTVIYVGGVSNHYDGSLLLDTMEELYHRDNSCRLILICREQEWKNIDDSRKTAPWIEVHHVTGDALAAFYSRATVALGIAKKDNPYNDIAISVKVFEYMSYGLPQVAVDTYEMGKLFRREKIGIPVDSNSVAMADAIEKLLNDEALCKEYETNIREALLNRHLWNHRVQQIVEDLAPVK